MRKSLVVCEKSISHKSYFLACRRLIMFPSHHHRHHLFPDFLAHFHFPHMMIPSNFLKVEDVPKWCGNDEDSHM